MNGNYSVKKILFLFFLCLITEKSFASQQKRGGPYHAPKGCSQLRCKKEDQCISRKFWCKSPPCPQMLYCSKSRKESLKGPTSCSSVRCSKGYVCVVKVRNCNWDGKCKQQIARCVTEREYYEGPSSCADFQCPEGYTCILRESVCTRPPCKVLKSCARSSDTDRWFAKCKELGCLSQYECFLRGSMNNCTNPPCTHSLDCILNSENDFNENCRGWVCPKNQDCSAQVLEPCRLGICEVSRTCEKTSFDPNILTQRSATELKTLTDLEKDWFYHEEEKRKLQANSMATISPAINRGSVFQKSGYDGTRQLFFKSGEPSAILQGQNLDFLNSAWSVPNAPNVPVYKYPTYVASTPQPKNIFSSDRTTVKSVTSSSRSWLESLKSRTGTDIINFWVRKAEKNQNYMQFQEWLESIRETLDPEMYRLWLEEVRFTTSYSKKFQDWLPLPLPSQHLNMQYFSDFESKINDMEGEILSAFSELELDLQHLEMPEEKENIDISSKKKAVNKISNDVAKFAVSPTSNTSKNSEMEKPPLIPTFIVIQTPRTDQNIVDSQQLIQLLYSYFNDPRFLAQLNHYQYHEFQAQRPPINNFMSQTPFFPYLPENNFPFRKDTFPGIHWQNLLYSYPKNYPLMPQINHNLIPPNYWNQYLKPFSGLNNANLGFQHFNHEYPASLNNRPEEIYNPKYFEIFHSNHEPPKINWRNYLEQSGNNFHRDDEDLRSKINRLSGNPDFLTEKEKEEREIEFLVKLLQDIFDFGLNEKEQEKNESVNEDLLETLIRILEEELDSNKKTTKNRKSEPLLDEIEKKEESTISSVFSKNLTLMDNLNRFLGKYTKILSKKEYDSTLEDLSKFFNLKEQDSELNISIPEIPKREETAPEIILPKAGYYDFVKNSNLEKSGSSNRGSKQTGMAQNVKSLSKNTKVSNNDYTDD